MDRLLTMRIRLSLIICLPSFNDRSTLILIKRASSPSPSTTQSHKSSEVFKDYRDPNEVGRQQETLQLTERVLEARKRTLGDEHPDTLRSMHALANRYSEALQLAERVVEAYKRILGEEHSNTVASIHTLMNLKIPPQDATRTYQRPPSAQTKPYAQHANGGETKRYSTFTRFWKRLT